MSQYISSMNQVATYWPPGVSDGQGSTDFSTVDPVLISCRWQNDFVLFRDSEGRETTSSAVVYPAIEVEIGGYMALGDLTATGDPRDVDTAFEIRQRYRTHSLDGISQLDKAML